MNQTFQLTLQILLYLIIFLTSIPLGLYISKLCADELVKDRRYILATSLLFVLSALILFFAFFQLALIFALLYFAIVMAIMLKKSRDKKFIKKYI